MKINNKCDSCGGNLVFMPDDFVMGCEHCGNTKPIKRSKQISTRPLVQRYSESYLMMPKEISGQTYICSSCGTTVSFEERETKRRCPSCGDTSLHYEKRSVYVPDAIVPFVISREKAIGIFRNWIASRKFAPRDLKEMAKHGKISGLYIPTWNFGFRLMVDYSADVTRTFEHEESFYTKHFYINNIEEKSYTNVLLSGNKRISNATLDEIEPFDISKMVPFSNEYVCGFSGLDTDVDIHKSFDAEVHKKEQSVEDKIRKDLKRSYEVIEKLDTHSQTKNETFSYAYVPVWANHFTYNGKQYHCYINGQTGKATGKAPKSIWKILGLVGGIVGAVLLAAVLLF